MAASFKNIFLQFLPCLILLTRTTCLSQTLEQDGSIRGDVQLRSSNGLFVLGFDSFKSSYDSYSFRDLYSPPRYLYLGIQCTYEDPSLVGLANRNRTISVWVANRNTPIFDRSGELIIDKNGSLKIVHSGGEVILYEAAKTSKTSATLEDSGNLVLYELNPGGSKKQVLWQSFDYPTDTFLPGMKLGIDLKTGRNWSLSSWRSYRSAAPGSFTLEIDPYYRDQLVIRRRGEIHWTSGSWRNGYFGMLTSDSPLNTIYNFSYVSNENETYFSLSVDKSASIFPILKLDRNGRLLGSSGMNGDETYVDCDYFSESFWSGCTQQKLPHCRRHGDFDFHEGYMRISGYKFDENENLSLVDCRAECLRNCSCAAYAPTKNDGTGCEIWSSASDYRDYKPGENRREIYFTDKSTNWWLWLTIALGVCIVTPSMFSFCYLSLTNSKYVAINQTVLLNEIGGNSTAKIHDEDGNELQMFSFDVVAAATNYFSATNKLGEGGFGPVYKGRLSDGREVAIKRLSRSSGQGLVEFKNEALLIAKLQHTNLVRLLGFCFQVDEKMLIYEYMRNKSLDFFLFNSSKKKNLDWKKRFNIIEGIAQGLLYLHKYSRLRVIHRDLKPSNILLDDEMNPKISDFGMARIFGMRESEANTNRVVGTFGYMSPEYAMSGIVSMKVDVFSFEVLILEIVSGKKNNAKYHPEYPLNLIGHAWKLWKEGRGLDILEPSLQEFCPQNVLRCIHVGLLCVQYHATVRPTMTDVVTMLSNETMAIPEPNQPAFFINEAGDEEQVQENKPDHASANLVSITVMEAR